MPFRGMKSIFFYLISDYFFHRRKLALSRKWMDRSLTNDPNPHPFVLANDAILLVLEDRSTDATRRFRDCLAALSSERSANYDYVELFCSFWLAVLSKHASYNDLEAMKFRASQLKADRWLRRKLFLPSLETMKKFSTGSSMDTLEQRPELKASSIKVSFDH